MLTFFLQGAIAGLAIAIPVGSSSALTMTIGARYGWKPGLAAGAGSGMVLGVFAFLAVFLGKLGVTCHSADSTRPAVGELRYPADYGRLHAVGRRQSTEDREQRRGL
ncbi:hypothetical protein [Bifidobacterium crudilactis]|uniref:hypothetical protein n=1 Tax=Bifidobacterium crudilactis TaxID=327277 RepID=UPI002F360A54